MDFQKTIQDYRKTLGIIFAGVVVTLVVYSTQNFMAATYAAFILFLIILAYGLHSLRSRLALILFDLLIFLFLLGRPLIDHWSNYLTYNPVRYSFEQGFVASQMLLVTLWGLLAGHVFYEEHSRRTHRKNAIISLSPTFQRWLKHIALAGFFVSSAAMITVNIEKVIFRQSHDYASLYSSFRSQLPFVIIGFAEVGVAFLVLYIAVTKKVWQTAMVLSVYLLTTGILVPIGQRAPMGRAILFSFFVLFYKIVWQETRQKRLIKSLIIVFVMVIAILTPVFYHVGVTRWGDQAEFQDINPLLYFIHGQSVSYQVLAYGPDLLKIPKYAEKQYTFGPFLNQYINDLPDNPYTQEYLDHGDSYAADIGYFLLGSPYFEGNGMGSSYVIEVYAEYGQGGLFLFSLFLGALLAGLSNIRWQHFIIDLLKLRILMDIFYIPRAPAIRFMLNLAAAKFVVPILCALVLAWILNKGFRCEVNA